MAERQFRSVSRLDMAAAASAAIISPRMPTGSWLLNEIREHFVGFQSVGQARGSGCVIIRKQACAYEHKHGPDGDTHHNSYIGRFLGIPVVFGSKITLYDGLVRTVFCSA